MIINAQIELQFLDETGHVLPCNSSESFLHAGKNVQWQTHCLPPVYVEPTVPSIETYKQPFEDSSKHNTERICFCK